MVMLVIPPAAGGTSKFNPRVLQICQKNREDYAKKWGIPLIVEDSSIVDTSRPTAWSKIRVLQKYFHQYDWLVWIDGDTFIQ